MEQTENQNHLVDLPENQHAAGNLEPMELNQLESQGDANPERHSANSASIRYAGFWMRFWAYLLDLVVIGSIERILVNPLFRMLDISLSEFNMFAPVSIASAVIFYLYFVLMTKFFNQTIGKMVFGMKVIDLKHEKLTWGTVLFREWIGRFISTTVIIGYMIVAFLPKKQGLHDLFTDTTVIHIER
ncbi:RDD family protein [Neobacillus dielmonensis]|uniref:RDD family protein n=1 Tax=Neobacillus dielmonensis TaxID=1347369 RepID=UPI0009DD3316|nr:RDD family protein [Neobacillus dielmonensis]